MSARPSARAWIGLGANLGDPRAAFVRALDALARAPGVELRKVSSLYRSAPVDATGPDFLNAVAELRTTLPPLALLHRLQALEQAEGRERPFRNAPRTLDLDLLAVDGATVDAPELQLPHPRAHLRRFVLEPWLELDPQAALAGHGPLAGLLEATRDQALERVSEPNPWFRPSTRA